MMKYQVTLSLVILLAGCAAEEQQKVAAVQAQSCEKTFHVGSHIPVRDCDQPAVTDVERQRDYDKMRQTTTTVTNPH